MAKSVDKTLSYELVTARRIMGTMTGGQEYMIPEGTFVCALYTSTYLLPDEEIKKRMQYSGFAHAKDGVTRGPYLSSLPLSESEIRVKRVKRFNVASSDLITLDQYKQER